MDSRPSLPLAQSGAGWCAMVHVVVQPNFWWESTEAGPLAKLLRSLRTCINELAISYDNPLLRTHIRIQPGDVLKAAATLWHFSRSGIIDTQS
jgi:hypothetical protein